MQEIWKDIEGYEGIYQISNLAKIKRIAPYSNQYNIKWKSNKILNTKIQDQHDYCIVILSKNNKRHCFRVHRLVAQTFIPNPENKPQVNHIDGNKSNNKVSNLEWCTCSENLYHSYRTLHRKSAVAKRIMQYDLNHTFIKLWESSLQIEKELHINHSNIIQCCNNKRKTANNFIWRYAD